MTGWWYTYPFEKWWSESQLGWWHSQLNEKIKHVPNHQPDEYGWALGDLKINVKTPKSSKFVAPNLLKFLLCGGFVKKYNTTRIECFITFFAYSFKSNTSGWTPHFQMQDINDIPFLNSHSISQSIIPFSDQAMVKKPSPIGSRSAPAPSRTEPT